jgi:hypothetical protein
MLYNSTHSYKADHLSGFLTLFSFGLREPAGLTPVMACLLDCPRKTDRRFYHSGHGRAIEGTVSLYITVPYKYSTVQYVSFPFAAQYTSTVVG